MYTPIDPLARFGAMMMMALVVGLVMISAYDHRATRTAEASGPVLAPTPRIVMVFPTAAPLPTKAPAPIATPEPVYIIQYVEVPVYLPATVDSPPPPIMHEQAVSVPPGAVQVTVSDNGAPVVSSIHVIGLDGADRPARLGGETSKQVRP